MTATLTAASSLAAISHGTSSPQGQAAVRALVEEVKRIGGDDPRISAVALGHVDVQQPDIGATLAQLPLHDDAVLVPLLLSAGYHVNVDMRQGAAASGRPARIAAAMGPSSALTTALISRLAAGGARQDTHAIVLGAAGSSDPSAVADVEAAAGLLAEQWGAQVTPAYLAFAQPTVAQAVDQLKQQNPDRPVAVASYLLAPGYFQNLMVSQGSGAGADLVTDPILAVSADNQPDVPQGIAQLVVDRFTQALAEPT